MWPFDHKKKTMFKDINEIKSRDESTFSRIATKGI